MKTTRILHDSATHPGESPASVVFVKCDVCKFRQISVGVAPAEDVTRADPDKFIEESLIKGGWFIRDGMHVCHLCDRLYRKEEDGQ